MKSITCSGIFILLIVTVIMAGCHSESHQRQHESEPADLSNTQTAVPQTFKGSGTVVSIPPSKRHLMVKHGDIPGFMNAMTMPMFVRDTSLVRDVTPGDSISFTIEEGEGSIFITKIEVIE
ncbi:MAG: copper-binding protein [Cyclonatronaceae bacterium]